jgi:hypothetical protein
MEFIVERLWNNDALPMAGQRSQAVSDASSLVRDAFNKMKNAGYHLSDIELWIIQEATSLGAESRILNGLNLRKKGEV